MTTETIQTPATTTETFNLFRAAVRANYPDTLIEKAGVKWPVSPSRMMYLAYGILRGVPYRVMEPTARPLFDKMGHSEHTFLKGLAALVTFAGVPTTPEELRVWMAVPESTERLTKRTTREAAAQAVRAARRDAHKAPAPLSAVA
jgi:hypothetical protein